MTRSLPCPASETEHQFQASFDPSHDSRSQQTHSLRQKRLVDGQNLGHIDHRVSREPRLASLQEHIARGVGQAHIGRDNGHYHGIDAAFVEGIILNHQDRTPKAWARAPRLGKRGPPDLSTSHYHSSFGREAHCMCAKVSSRRDDSWL
jgi:hypothetical protein